MKVFVVYSQLDFDSISADLRSCDWVIGDGTSAVWPNYKDVGAIAVPNQELSQSFRAMLEKDPITSSIINHYANNFYECSLLPIVRYYLALEEVIERFDKELETVVFASGQNKIRSSTYYMAEHETQGYRWYRRSSVFTPYLTAYLEKKNVCYVVANTTGTFQLRLDRFLRRYAVFFGKFLKTCKDLVRVIGRTKKKGQIINPKVIVVTRAQSQSAFFLPFLRELEEPVLLLAGESTIGFGKNIDWLKGNKGDISVRQMFKMSDLLVLFNKYIYCYFLLLRRKSSDKVLFRDLEIDLSDAIKEVIVMYPELAWYKHLLKRNVEDTVRLSTVEVLYTSEQKSPHASIEAEVAREYGLRCLQFMSCDQEYTFIPRPVVGDAFLVDTAFSKECFLKQFPGSVIEYVGSLKGIRKKKSVIEKDLICYFTNPRFIELNKKIITLLNRHCDTTRFEIAVKLHPRDSISNYVGVKNIRFIRHGEIDFEELSERILFALTNNSGVVMDLLYQDIPYVLLRFMAEDRFDVPYIDDGYKNVCYDEVQLIERLNNLASVQTQFYDFRDRFLERNNITVSAKEISNNINRLLNGL